MGREEKIKVAAGNGENDICIPWKSTPASVKNKMVRE